MQILNARLVEVLEPHAFVVESATDYGETVGQRDRILVLLEAARLRLPAESVGGSTVIVLGVARTVLGARVAAEVPWPARLDHGRLGRLQMRAAVLATSVWTAEGTELTDRR